MSKMDREMDESLRAKVEALHAADDESGDGQINLPDLKLQLDRLEAQLELQDAQNRRLLRNQKRSLVIAAVLVLILCSLMGLMMFRFSIAYREVLDVCSEVNALADTLQDSLSTLDSDELDAMMQTLPEIADKLSKIDVDALNDVMQKLPDTMDAVTKLQQQTESITQFFGNLGSVFGQS
ncbi:MAG: hypothetical protein U0L91_02465 [Gemmiger sp.]|uniref:hypothetical protein n=1 Tax=Gemmiger sp. TaxID=2049027 RepID=UPI002E772155|nr:hypothetical protein [Gemmiger sp.]MEE0800125.1 hypothetical protein [Gemmiger sp.]